jgi:hypothetical protein
LKGRVSSNSDLFAKRGDPWVTRKQGENEFGRNLDSENPELDQFFASFAVPKPEYKEPPPLGKVTADYARRKMNILTRGDVPAEPDGEDPFNRFR